MASFLDFFPMVMAQQCGRQQLERRPEPSQVTAAADNVVQYDQVMSTKLVLAYAAGLQTVHRALAGTGGMAVDLACGPGHYTLCLARYLKFEKVLGIDLSPGMFAIASQNATQQGLDRAVSFQRGDVTNLADLASGSFSLSSFTDAAHHMPDIETVGQVLREMDRVTRPDGLVMVMDLARLRTAKLTERYVNTLGHDYVARGLPAFLDDFRNSMYAAFTVAEMRQAIPRKTRRFWCHVVPRGLPTTQIILGLPEGRSKPMVRGGVPWDDASHPIPDSMRSEWSILSSSLAFGAKAILAPG